MKNNINLNPFLILRIGLAGVFIYAGTSILASPNRWTGFVPNWIESIIPVQTFTMIHGTFELIIGLLLLFGVITSIASFLAFLDLLLIMIFLGINDLTFRDFGLALAALALFIQSVGEYENPET